MTVAQLVATISHDLPLDLAVDGDPVGLQLMPSDGDVPVVAVAYEATERVVKRAVEAEAGLLVVFHPLFYPAAAAITTGERIGRVAIELIRRGIALYVVHTAFDAHPQGTSRLLAREMGLHDIRPLEASDVLPGAGMGAIGTFSDALPLEDVAERVRKATAAAVVRWSAPAATPTGASPRVARLAILGGSGMSYYDRAVAMGADAILTADVRYHAFHAANDRIPVIDPGHAESERFVLSGLTSLVRHALAAGPATVDVIAIDEPTNPIRYLV